MDNRFDTPLERRNTCSYKWDSVPSDVIPMWVADMDFPTAPCVQQAVVNRSLHGAYGYTKVPEEFYTAVIKWFGRRHGWSISRDWILYTSGVVPAISAVIKALANPGDEVLTLTPVYNCFFSSIRNNGCTLCESPLIYADNSYTINFNDFEQKAARPEVKLFLLCNPHNPSCRVWSEAELMRLGEICLRNGVIVVSDEIHCELTMPGFSYVPFGRVSDRFADNTVVCTSPSKAFNTAGLQIANIITTRADWRERIDRAININEVCDVNPFGVEALIAAYNEGEQWLDDLCSYIWQNYLYAKEYLTNSLPQVGVTNLEGTYLMWVDCRSLKVASDEMERILLTDHKVLINSGTMYGSSGEGFIRVNLACPRTTLKEGMSRIAAGLKNLANR